MVGQGALGTLFSVILARAGHDVHVVSSRAGEAEMVQLSVRGRRELDGIVTLRDGMPADSAWIALVCTRADDALEATQRASKVLTDDGAAATVQNGLRSLEVADAVGTDRVLPVVVGFNAQMRGPRTVELTSRGGITTGALSPETQPAMERLIEAMQGPIPADAASNPRGAVWSKWCISCAINGLAVITGDGVGPLTQKRRGREALVNIVTEGVELAKAEGVELERVAGPFAPDTLAGDASSGLAGALRRGVTWLIGRGYGDVVPSSLDALREGRDPEIDAINGTAVRLGEAHGIETPWNRAVVEMAEEIAAGERKAGLDQLEPLTQRAARGPA